MPCHGVCFSYQGVFSRRRHNYTQLMSSEGPDIMVTVLHGTLGNLCREGSLQARRTVRICKWAGRVVLGF